MVMNIPEGSDDVISRSNQLPVGVGDESLSVSG